MTTSASHAATRSRGNGEIASPRPRRWVVLVALLAVAEAAGLLGVPFTDRVAGGWYDQLDKPSFNPPSWVFAPVWTTLYVLIAVAAWRVWRLADGHGRTTALRLWTAQLVLNALWTPTFFGAHHAGLALVVLALLLMALGATVVAFLRLDRAAGSLLLPYLAWVSFATVLNAAIVALN